MQSSGLVPANAEYAGFYGCHTLRLEIGSNLGRFVAARNPSQRDTSEPSMLILSGRGIYNALLGGTSEKMQMMSAFDSGFLEYPFKPQFQRLLDGVWEKVEAL